MTSKHTPGPWRVSGHTIVTAEDYPVSSGPTIAFMAAGRSCDDATIEADAKLIADAPTMADALAEMARIATEFEQDAEEREEDGARDRDNGDEQGASFHAGGADVLRFAAKHIRAALRAAGRLP